MRTSTFTAIQNVKWRTVSQSLDTFTSLSPVVLTSLCRPIQEVQLNIAVGRDESIK